MRLSSLRVSYGWRWAVCFLNLGEFTGRLVKCVLSLGIRNGDEVVVAVGRVLTQVEMSRGEGFLMAMMLGAAQAKYMVLRVSW